MKKYVVTNLSVWIAAICLLGGVGLAQEAVPPFRPERCLPSDTIAYAEIPDFEASKARFKETAIYKIWSEPEIQVFAAPIKDFLSKKFGEFKEPFVAEVGLPFDELYTAFSGQIAGALIRINVPPPPEPGEAKQKAGPDVVEAAVFLTPKEPERVKALIAALHAYIHNKEKSAVVETADYDGVTVTEIYDKAKPTDPTLAHTWLGGTFVLAIGPRKKTMQEVIGRWRGQTEGSLLQNENFAAARKRVVGDHTDFFAYLNVAHLLGRLDAHIGADIRPALEAAGVYSIKSVCYNLTFDGPAFRDVVYVSTASEKKGFVHVLSPAPLDEKVLDQVPAQATMFVATRFNPALLWQAIDGFAAGLGDEKYVTFRDAIARADEFLETDIEKDILPAFGDYALLYSQPSQMGPMMFGLLDFVAVIHVKDKLKAEVAGELLRQKTAEMALKQAQQGGAAAVPFYWQSVSHGGTTIHYVTITAAPVPFLMPAYAITEDKLVIGLSLQTVQNTLTRLAKPGPGIRTRPDFAQVYPKVSKGAGVIIYSDVKANFPQTHAMLSTILAGVQVMLNVQQGDDKLAVNRAILNARQGEGKLMIDMTKFPPAEVFMKHLFGSVMVVKGEEAGIVVESYSPGNSLVGVGGAAIVAAIAIPSLVKARAAVHKTVCLSNLRQIGLGITMYMEDFNDKFPPDLQTLYPKYVPSKQTFKCHKDKAPKREQWGKQTVEVSYTYIFIPGGLDTVVAPSEAIIAFDSKPRHEGKRTVLFVDGHVQSMKEAAFQEKMAAQKWKPTGWKPADEDVP
ncbi:MAG: hypothetical protein GXP25_16750 [Planctomycetes bacterium]|nr:hypothetical protein [Planctomycetota bacterium]